MSAKYKSPSFLLPNELNTSANTANDTGINSLYSMDFDGSSYINAGSTPQALVGSNSAYTVSAWVKPDATGNLNIIGAMDSGNRWYFRVLNGHASYAYGAASGGNNYQGTATPVTLNTWSHIMFTFDGSTTHKIYVNGVLKITQSNGSAQTITNSQNAYIGALNNNGSTQNYFDGQIDEVAIFNRALNTTEIAALYDGTGSNIRPSNLMATDLNPIAYYPLGEQAQNSGYPSASGNEWQFPNGVLQDYVMDFDGVNDFIDLNANNSFGFGTGDFTISMWLYREASSYSFPYILDFRESTSAYNQNRLAIYYQESNGKLRCYINGSDVLNGSTGAALPLNQWFNLILTRSSGTLSYYVNGSVDQSVSNSTNLLSTNQANLGRRYDNDRYFNGKISNLAIWNSSAANIANIYNNGSPQTNYTVAPQNWWKLNADSVYTPSVSKYPTALNFASNSYIISSSSVITGNSDRTVSVWAKTPNYVSKKAIFSLGDTTGSGSTTKFAIRINGTDDIQIASKGYDFLFSNTGIIVTDNNWHHFAATYSYSGSTAYFKLYIDGNYIGEQTGSLQLNTSAGFSIATWGYGSNRDFFNGDISNAVVYNSELTATQISTLFNFGTPETTPSFDPVAWWKLDDQTAITDSSGNGNTGTNNGATNAPGGVAYVPSWKITSALPIPTVNYTTALDFDGNNDLVNANSVVSSISSSTTGTVSGWIKYTTGGSAAYMITFTSNTNTSQQYLTFQGNSNGVAFAQIKNKWILQTNSAVFTSGNWYHYAVTQNETEPKIYINGTEYSNGNGAALTTYVGTDGTEWWPNLIDFNTVTIGGMIWNSGGTVYTNYGDQDLSNISIYNSALSSSQVSTLFNSGQPEAAISFSPVSWWKLDTGGSTITDYGSGGNNGTNNGATQVTSDVLISGFNIPVNGVSTTLPSTALQQSDLQFDSPYSNYSLSFDGNSYIDTNFTLPASYTSFSYSFWFKRTTSANPGTEYIISNLVAPGNNNQARGLIRFGGTNLRIQGGDGTSPDYDTGNISATAILDQNWHHISVTFVSGEIKTYFDGSLVDTYTNAAIVTGYAADRTYVIGQNGVGTGYLVNSMLDEFAIFNKKLTEAEILSIYNNGKPNDISTTAPTNWWRLGENAYFVNNNITLPNSVSGAPNGVSSGTATSMLTADAPGTYANGIGDGLAITDRVGDAALSVANSQSYNMIPDDKVPYVPGYVGAQISNTYSMTFDGTNYFSDIGTGLKSTFEWCYSFYYFSLV